MQCVAAWCSVLQCVTVYCSVLQCIAVCCSVLHCVAVCCSVLQCVAVCCSVLQYVAVCCSVLQCFTTSKEYIAVCCSVLHYGTVCCSVVQCVAVFHHLEGAPKGHLLLFCFFSEMLHVFQWVIFMKLAGIRVFKIYLKKRIICKRDSRICKRELCIRKWDPQEKRAILHLRICMMNFVWCSSYHVFFSLFSLSFHYDTVSRCCKYRGGWGGSWCVFGA